MQVWIIAGGSLELPFFAGQWEEAKAAGEELLLIAADRGAIYLRQLDLRPDYLIGDFDSVSEEERAAVEEWQIPMALLPSHKNDTDTEAALSLAMLLDRRHFESLPEQERSLMDLQELPEGVGSYEVEQIRLYGATGSRIDHVLGAISILAQTLEARGGQGIACQMIDPKNRLRLVDPQHPLRIRREEQWGDYFSSIPLFAPCEGVCLRGVAYPIEEKTMDPSSSLGISNEILSCAEISVKKGRLLIVESRD